MGNWVCPEEFSLTHLLGDSSDCHYCKKSFAQYVKIFDREDIPNMLITLRQQCENRIQFLAELSGGKDGI